VFVVFFFFFFYFRVRSRLTTLLLSYVGGLRDLGLSFISGFRLGA